jgi:hypothetical protein
VSTSVGLGVALGIAAIALVPLGLRLVGAVSRPAEHTLDFARTASLPAGVLVGLSLVMPAGPFAAGLTLPWLAVGATAALAAVLDEVGGRRPLGRDVRHAELAALVFLAVAPGFAMADRLGVRPFGIDPLIVRLTAIHFVFAGFVLPLVGGALWRLRPATSLELALGTIVVGIPLTALGFLGFPVANWVGALLVAGGGFGVGLAAVSTAARFRDPTGRWLMRVAGGSLLLAMPLGALYATGLVLGLAWLDIPTMARIHGTLNALGFALPSLVALTLETRRAAGPFPVAVRAGR